MAEGRFYYGPGRDDDLASDRDNELSGPFRSPPSQEFIFFSESARSMLECVELNSEQGTFVGPTKPRLSALAVVEAVDREGNPCNVRVIGRILQKVTRPYPLIRIKWVRALSPLDPVEFIDCIERYYGFVIDLDIFSLDLEEFAGGTEYDFTRQIVIPRTQDTARGDSRPARKRGGSGSVRRLYDVSGRKVRNVLGDTTTRVGLTPPDDR